MQGSPTADLETSCHGTPVGELDSVRHDLRYTPRVLLDLEIALRFLRRRTGPLLRGTALAALGGVALATAALVITLALMNGYSQAIAVALQRGNAHLVGFSPRPLDLAAADDLADRLAALPGVERATPVTYLAGLVQDPAEPTTPVPVVLKAVAARAPSPGRAAGPPPPAAPAVGGGRLAAELDLTAGALTSIQLPPREGEWLLPALPVTVVGTFSLGFPEFDEEWIVVPLDRVLAVAPDSGVAAVELDLADPMAVDDVREAVAAVAPHLLITDWREMNRSLFAALRWQTLSLFVVLSLVAAVASFQVSSAVVVLTIHKRQATGTLQALGATPARVCRVLLLTGTVLGATGVGLGLATGVAISQVLSRWQLVRFPPDLARVYMVDSIPFVVAPHHLAAVAAVCLALVSAASLWPAWRSSRLDPVAALRAV